MSSPPPRVRLVAIDIDGTLLPTTSTVISARSIAALHAAAAAGIEIVIATGRRQAYALPLLTPVGLPPETVLIGSNGTTTRTFGGDVLDRWLLPVPTAIRLCGELRAFGGATVFTFDFEGPGALVLESVDQLHEQIALWVRSNRAVIREIQPLERAFDSGEAPIQGMACGTIRAMREAEEHLLANGFGDLIQTHRTEYPRRDLGILDIMPPGCSKGVALDRLASRGGLQASQIAAIGDNYNDREMLEYAGHPVVMANSAPEILEIAADQGWRITDSNDNDGVALYLEELVAQTHPRSNGEAASLDEIADPAAERAW